MSEGDISKMKKKMTKMWKKIEKYEKNVKREKIFLKIY
jgi:DNA-binding protein YbaB